MCARRERADVAPTGGVMEPIELVRKMCEEVYGQGKTELMRELLADDVVSNDPVMGKIDRAGIEANVKRYRSAFPDMNLKVIDTLGSGDKAMVRWQATGTHRGELMGMPATNKKVTIDGITEVRCSGGKIKESWDQWNALALMQQVGAIPETLARPDGGGPRAGAAQQQPRR
jgi:steroid delta-isomerase-like uncharacterized protein